MQFITCVLIGTIIYWVGVSVYTPCEAEDSTFCYWDASTRGNGLGQSFINIGGVNVWY